MQTDTILIDLLSKLLTRLIRIESRLVNLMESQGVAPKGAKDARIA